MFGIPGQPAVTMTPAAVKHIAKLMSRENAAGFRIGVKKGGCAGMEYTMEIAQEAGPMDMVIEEGAARVLIAPTAQMFMIGTEIDYETGLLESGFKFRNPNVAESCGCGESIKFKDIGELSAETQPEDGVPRLKG
ncbi:MULTISPECIES: HesB/IscA family protein [Thioclava]|uniref:Iron-sulfur cluster assembly accessory protein n=1 Tax=Thioclava litoralis TaxID=3076557 RepID=A0ABZ1E0Z8_9RHOB|nr:iron-sulfur cluster assembly accessory protein [Thioclava sp. FTW29]